jgi:hypothetical protein
MLVVTILPFIGVPRSGLLEYRDWICQWTGRGLNQLRCASVIRGGSLLYCR